MVPRAYFVVGMFLLSPWSVTAQDNPNNDRDSGNGLKRHLAEDAGFNAGEARGYVLGVADSLSGLTATYCEPAGVTNGQLLAIVQKFLDDHPELLHKRRGQLVSKALIDAFPCPKTK